MNKYATKSREAQAARRRNARRELQAFEPRVDLAGKLSLNADDEVIYAFGRNTKGVRVKDDPGFAQWILDRDFPRDTKAVLQQLLDDMRDKEYDEEPVLPGNPEEGLF
jgi:hypothetical protein